MKTFSANAKDSYVKVVVRSITKVNETSTLKRDSKSNDDNIKKCFRIQGIPEDVDYVVRTLSTHLKNLTKFWRLLATDRGNEETNSCTKVIISRTC